MKFVQERQTSADCQEEDIITSVNTHNRYGKLLVLFQSRRLTLTLGPHYYCFLPALAGFIAAAVFLTLFVNQIFQNRIFQLLNALFSVLWVASYLMVALANPGIVFPEASAAELIEGKTRAKCKECGAVHREKNVRHCSYCDVCIREYDHHCPWVSKCIGAENVALFNFFVGITPLYIMYYIVVLCVCLARSV